VRLTCRVKRISSVHMQRTIALSLAFFLATPAMLSAEPAPFFQWRSKANGSLACSQTPLGPGWERAGGPYRDARCEKRKAVK
jgi:hypothetical protein